MTDWSTPAERRASRALTLARILAAVDVGALPVAVPTIQDDLDVPLSDLQRGPAVFPIGYAPTSIPGGTLADRFERRRIYLIGIGVFAGGALFGSLTRGAEPLALTHGDYYADHLRLRGDRVAVLDWGPAFAGFGAYDAARLNATSDARTPTAEFLRWAFGMWAAELRACGVPDYPDTVAYADFRLGVALAFPTVLTALVDESDPRRAATAAARSARVRSALAALGIDFPASILPPA